MSAYLRGRDMSYVLQQTVSQLSWATVGRQLIPDCWVTAAALGIPGLISEAMRQRTGKTSQRKTDPRTAGKPWEWGLEWGHAPVNACIIPAGASAAGALLQTALRLWCGYSLLLFVSGTQSWEASLQSVCVCVGGGGGNTSPHIAGSSCLGWRDAIYLSNSAARLRHQWL